MCVVQHECRYHWRTEEGASSSEPELKVVLSCPCGCSGRTAVVLNHPAASVAPHLSFLLLFFSYRSVFPLPSFVCPPLISSFPFLLPPSFPHSSLSCAGDRTQSPVHGGCAPAFAFQFVAWASQNVGFISCVPSGDHTAPVLGPSTSCSRLRTVGSPCAYSVRARRVVRKINKVL